MADDFEVLNSDDDEPQETILDTAESAAEETKKRTREEEEPTVVKVRRGSDHPADQDGERKKRKGWASAAAQDDTTSITSDLLKPDTTNGDTEEQHESVREQNGSETEEAAPEPPMAPTRCLHVQHFVRPLTKMQVDELLAEAGTLVDDPDMAFWMDRKKSHMYCTYETVEMAVAAYGIMNGLKFPPINPRTLKVDYVPEEEIKDLIAKAAAAEGGVPDRRRASANQRPALPPSTSRASDRERETRGRGRRESKEEKEQQRGDDVKETREEKREEMGKEKEKEKKTEAREEKSLDDLFRKTTTEPVIYWLPLTDEQIKAKEEAKRKSR
eukprot:comp22211_c1_seq2/m.32696 comp22211_c1_seq2/g.32696  ORF comp22211_c1_seq2/g.32696 comp22211_c1_seq2/m.32696 type:complete len:328 (-) comp22211_c1_seq2:132-1115(-)